MTPLKALIIDNGIGAAESYPDREDIVFDRVRTGPGFCPDLDQYDLLIIPNGADHVAMFGIRNQVRAMLDAGKSLFCFCGWFLDWIPGNRWVHDNSHPTREMRHFVGNDPRGLLDGLEMEFLDHNRHGISGWWACGYIEPTDKNAVLIKDTWGRAVAVADETTTSGFLFLTASGPVGDYSASPTWKPLGNLYNNAVRHVIRRARHQLSSSSPPEQGERPCPAKSD
jgi:hypothetical protein